MADSTVCLTVDFDAVSAWIHWDAAHNTPTNRSRGQFGADVGAPRLLDLLDRHDLPATWFVPGHTVESFPEVCEAVDAAGHEIQHHGWSHVSPADQPSGEAERADLERGIEAIEALTGRRPTGYRSPSWEFSEYTVDLLVDLDFEWDSSGMATEFEPYRLRTGERAEPDEPYDRGEPTDLVELPVSWHRDDFPLLEFVGHRGVSDEAATFRTWRDGFDWMVDHGGGVYVLTVHPQVVGRSTLLARLESLVEHMRSRPGVEFADASSVVERVRDGLIDG